MPFVFVEVLLASDSTRRTNFKINSNSIILLKCASILFNIMLNNYFKAQNDNVRHSAVITKRATKF